MPKCRLNSFNIRSIRYNYLNISSIFLNNLLKICTLRTLLFDAVQLSLIFEKKISLWCKLLDVFLLYFVNTWLLKIKFYYVKLILFNDTNSI